MNKAHYPVVPLLVALRLVINHSDQMPILLTPFKGVNVEAIGFFAIIFHAVYVSYIFSSTLFTLGNNYISVVT